MWSGWASRPRRGRELVGWVILFLGAGALQLPALGRMAMHGVSIMQFELMYSSAEATRVTRALGADGLSAARQELYLDYAYLIIYGILLSGACILLGARALRRGHASIAKIAPVFAWVAVVAAVCDAVENAALLIVMFGHTEQPWPAIASGYASAKFVLLGVTLLFLVIGLLATATDRSVQPEPSA